MSFERNRRQKVVFLKASIIAAQKHLQVQPQTQLDIRSFFYLLKVLKRLRKLNTLHRDFPVPSLNNNNTMLCWWKDSSWSFDYVFKFLKLHFTYSMIFWIHVECRFFMKPIVAWQLCCAMIEHYTIDIFFTNGFIWIVYTSFCLYYFYTYTFSSFFHNLYKL